MYFRGKDSVLVSWLQTTASNTEARAKHTPGPDAAFLAFPHLSLEAHSSGNRRRQGNEGKRRVLLGVAGLR